MSTWVVPELENSDFTDDFEDMLIPYLWEKWSITNPDKGAEAHPEVSDGIVSFKSGFPDFFRPYECCCVQTRTTPLEIFNNAKFTFETGLDIMVRMKRLDRDALDVDPQLENMEQEVIRIVENYEQNEILGIKDLVFDTPSFQRIYNSRDKWAKSDWRSMIRVKVFYQKDNLL